MKTYLMAQGLWDIVEATNEPPTPENIAAFMPWSKMNAMALHVIQISCGPDTFSDIMKITSARYAWNTLAEKYEVDLSTISGTFLSQSLLFSVCKIG